jgi:hypothetical protein
VGKRTATKADAGHDPAMFSTLGCSPGFLHRKTGKPDDA